MKYDLQTAAMMLEEIEDALDRTEDSTGLVQTLDQLLVLSGQQPIAWEPKFRVKIGGTRDHMSDNATVFCSLANKTCFLIFQGIIDLLVGWHVDLGTNAAVRKRISGMPYLFFPFRNELAFCVSTRQTHRSTRLWMQ